MSRRYRSVRRGVLGRGLRRHWHSALLFRALVASVFAATAISGVRPLEASATSQPGDTNTSAPQRAAAQTGPTVAPPSPSERAVSKARGAVVVVECRDGAMVSSFGSGFAVGSPDLLATNAHVVQSCGDVAARIPGTEGGVPAVVVSMDVERDIAILYMPGRTGSVIALAPRQTVAVGQPVLAIGHPKGLELTVSDGIVSAIRETGESSLIQTSTPISPGSSGGPLIDLNGRAIGMATMYLREGQNLNFAVPAWEIAHLLTDAQKNRKEFERADRIGPYSQLLAPNPGAHVVQEMVRQGDRAAARDLLTKLLSRHPQSVPLLEQCVVVEMSAQHVDGVKTCGTRLSAVAPQSSYLILGGLFLQLMQGEEAKAIQYFEAEYRPSCPPPLRTDILVMAALAASKGWPVAAERDQKAKELMLRAGAEYVQDQSLMLYGSKQMLLTTIAIAADAAGNAAQANRMALLARDGMTEQNCPDCSNKLRKANLPRYLLPSGEPCSTPQLSPEGIGDVTFEPDYLRGGGVVKVSAFVRNTGCQDVTDVVLDWAVLDKETGAPISVFRSAMDRRSLRVGERGFISGEHRLSARDGSYKVTEIEWRYSVLDPVTGQATPQRVEMKAR